MAASRTLTLAVRDQLRAAAPPNFASDYVGYGLGLTAAQCEVMFDGRPMPNAGDLFFAVHHNRRQNQSLTGDSSNFAVDVTISMRCVRPFDRVGPEQIDVSDGLEAWADRVTACVWANQWGTSPLGIMNRANNYLPSGSYPWVEALYPTGNPQPQPQQEAWFNAANDQTSQRRQGGTMPFVGMSIVVSLVGAVRYQRPGDTGA